MAAAEKKREYTLDFEAWEKYFLPKLNTAQRFHAKTTEKTTTTRTECNGINSNYEATGKEYIRVWVR